MFIQIYIHPHQNLQCRSGLKARKFLLRIILGFSKSVVLGWSTTGPDSCANYLGIISSSKRVVGWIYPLNRLKQKNTQSLAERFRKAKSWESNYCIGTPSWRQCCDDSRCDCDATVSTGVQTANVVGITLLDDAADAE